MTVEKVPQDKLEPHLSATVGSHNDIWHRFKPPVYEQRGRDKVVVLVTRCGQRIYDHWNTRQSYNPRYDNPCGNCFPNGVTSEGRPKPSKRGDGESKSVERATADAASSADPVAGEQHDTGSGVPLTSTPEPLVSSDPDGGDGGSSHPEGSGVLGAGDEGHVEELPTGTEPGDSSVGGSPSPEAGQGESDREHRSQQPKQPARTQGKRSTGTNR